MNAEQFAKQHAGNYVTWSYQSSKLVRDPATGRRCWESDGPLTKHRGIVAGYGPVDFGPRRGQIFVMVEVAENDRPAVPVGRPARQRKDAGATFLVHPPTERTAYILRAVDSLLLAPSSHPGAFKAEHVAVAKKKAIDHYPNTCRACGSKAYVGATMRVDCSNLLCEHFNFGGA